MPFLLISFGGARLEQSNATRTSVAAASSMAANLYLRLPAQMQTSLATQTIIPTLIDTIVSVEVGISFNCACFLDRLYAIFQIAPKKYRYDGALI